MKFSISTLILFASLIGKNLYAQDETPPVIEVQNPHTIHHTKKIIPDFIMNWLITPKAKHPISLKADYQLEGLIGIYPPKIYYVIDKLKKRDFKLLLNRLILYGPPGNGKTSLARAIATAADCNFMKLKGPSVVGSYLGEGAQKIRELFKEAAQLYKTSGKPVVIFTDEIDAIARSDNYNAPARAEHQVATQELWTTMDEYKNHPGIYFICATNHFDKLDRTFLDRFSTSSIEIVNPDKFARQAILLHYLKLNNLILDDALLEKLVKHTEGLSRRALEDLVQDTAVSLLMYGPQQIDDATIWELLKETKKKFESTKNDPFYEPPLKKWHNRLSFAHTAIVLPVVTYQLYEMIKSVLLYKRYGTSSSTVMQNIGAAAVEI